MKTPDLKDQLKQLEKTLIVIYGIGLLVLVILSVFSNFLMKEQAARQATSLIKRTVERGDFRETIYTLNDAKLDYFDAVVYFNEDGSRLFSIPARLDPRLIGDNRLLTKLFYSRLTVDLFFGAVGDHRVGSVLFIFNRLSHVPYAIAIWLFFLVGTIPFVRHSRLRVTENYRRHVLYCEEATRADLARRVRHDIRSPLGALLIATQNMMDVGPKQQAMIQRATERISEIVGELELIRLAPKEMEPVRTTASAGPQSLLTIAQEIVQEKRLQLPGNITLMPEFSPDAFFLFVTVDAGDFKRTLSNIIDNAVEACADDGKIVVRVVKDKEWVKIEVVDNGHGISADNLARVTEKGFTKKPTGSGLGLYYAEKTARAAGGTLSLQSTPHVGTTVSVRLPSSPPPKWYVSAVNIPANGTVVIVDDQESTHMCWRTRLDELKAQGAVFSVASFKSPSEFLTWYRAQSANLKNSLFLLDYDLGDGKKTGLDMAHELKLGSRAILVTGHYDSEDVQRRCSEESIGLLPKSYLSLVQVQSV